MRDSLMYISSFLGKGKSPASAKPVNGSSGDCRGVSAAALQAVKLNKVSLI